MDPNDLVFHTSFPGSPLAIIKNSDNIQISPLTIDEAAVFVASFSRAWKESWNIVDIFYINPSQVSKTPPSGEYLPKGSFIINGKKTIIKNVKLELGIALKLEELEDSLEDQTKILYPKILCGPFNAIKTQVANKNIIMIKPSKTGVSKGKLAKKIIHYFINTMDHDFKKWVKLLPIDDILLKLPSGTSIMEFEN